MSESVSSSISGAGPAAQRDRLAVPAVLLAVIGAVGVLVVGVLYMATGFALQGGIPIGVWFLGQSVLSLLAYVAMTAGLIMGVVVAVRSEASRRAGYAAVAIVVVIGLLMHLFGIVRAFVVMAQGH
jgi:hypothetical protein